VAPSQSDVRHLVNLLFVADTNNLLRGGFLRRVVNNWSLVWSELQMFCKNVASARV